jgi:hypothetical protein
MGAKISDGVLAYKLRHNPVPLSELEKLLIVTSCGGNTSRLMVYDRCATTSQITSTGNPYGNNERRTQITWISDENQL